MRINLYRAAQMARANAKPSAIRVYATESARLIGIALLVWSLFHNAEVLARHS